MRDFGLKKRKYLFHAISLYKNSIFPFSISSFKTNIRDALKDIKLVIKGCAIFYHLFLNTKDGNKVGTSTNTKRQYYTKFRLCNIDTYHSQ